MTRKRYIKLLMARGTSRNEAQAFAREVVAEGISYQQDYDEIIGFATLFDKSEIAYKDAIAAIQRIVDEGLPAFIEAVKKMSEAAAAGLKAFTEAFRKVMET